MTKKKEEPDCKINLKPNYPTFRPGYYNTLTKTSEAECLNLKIGKPTTALLCGMNQKDKNSIVLDSVKSNSISNNRKNFISFVPKEEEIIHSDGSSIKSLGSGPSSKSFIATSKENRIIVDRSFESGNFIIHEKIHAFNFLLPTPSNTTIHQSSEHPSLGYFKRRNQNKNISYFNCTTYIPKNLGTNPDSTKIPSKASNYVELTPIDKRKDDENKNKPTNTLFQYKGYTWTTQTVDNSMEITSNLDPSNILTDSHQTKHSDNLTEANASDPKSYSQEIYNPDSEQ
ncbi:hypothetical protein O181_036845 [Austropuccinia psidii MF-1]|uniref:Uncharacterized protein n=1 Tax=Austropuccinia psidii MF-1 TaxID=1389203 RepID=A0A9Q3D769_9BASI|nr:hypothetical protein [Austropuccinia psidii MF-1]